MVSGSFLVALCGSLKSLETSHLLSWKKFLTSEKAFQNFSKISAVVFANHGIWVILVTFNCYRFKWHCYWCKGHSNASCSEHCTKVGSSIWFIDVYIIICRSSGCYFSINVIVNHLRAGLQSMPVEDLKIPNKYVGLSEYNFNKMLLNPVSISRHLVYLEVRVNLCLIQYNFWGQGQCFLNQSHFNMKVNVLIALSYFEVIVNVFSIQSYFEVRVNVFPIQSYF